MKTELTVTAAGQAYPVEIDGTGTFTAHLGGSHVITAPSYDELTRKARKVKVAFTLEFTAVRPDGPRNGAVTGIHAVNGNLLVRWDNGETEQITSWSHGQTMPRLTGGEFDELALLIAERNRAVQELDAFTKPRLYQSLTVAAKAVQAAAAGAEGDPS